MVVHHNVSSKSWLQLVSLDDDVVVAAAGLVAEVVVLDWGETATVLHRFEKIHAVLGVFRRRECVLHLLTDLHETAGDSAAHVNRLKDFFFKLALKGSRNCVSQVQLSKLLLNRHCWFHFSRVSTAHFV